MPSKTFLAAAAAAAFVFATAAGAQTTVKDPWVRGTVAQQKSTGLFAQFTSAAGGRIVAASSPAAGAVEIHEMAMDGNVMRMRAVSALELPAGQAVELKPGGYHVMLLDLKQQLKPGDTVPVTFVVEGKDGQRENVVVQAPVKELHAGHGGMKH
ncbi:MAG: copper chaperone PCu(A)C [Piscinibacter sp.]|nr:copper chaperone PCu(A)C [Piscinibacter sp.]